MVKPIKTAVHKVPPRHKALVSAISALLLILLVWPSEKAAASRNYATADELELGKRYQLPLSLSVLPLPPEPELQLSWVEHEIQPGESMARVFQQHSLTAGELQRLSRADDDQILQRVHPGDKLQLGLDEQQRLAELRYELNSQETLVLSRNARDNGFSSHRENKEVETRLEFAHGEISSNFWHAAVEAGLGQNMIMSLAEIFAWDIDFALDLRRGDKFSLLYEQRYVDGEYTGTGRIVAAEFTNQGETFQALRHNDGNYYTPEGQSMRQAFLRAPVHFTRISSDFNPQRKHPVTGQTRPHNGIDYAAPTGTPVMAAGSGRVIASGYNNFNGHYIFIRHGERYVTKYLHLERRLVSRGERVDQGQDIGRVGATGQATGPHLHYEFLVDGVHRNPRTVDLPKADSLPEEELTAFTGFAEQKIAMLENRKRVFLALHAAD